MRNVPAYALVVSQGGPQLKDRNYCYLGKNCSMDRLVDGLDADRPVLNRTNLTGLYDATIFYTPEFRVKNEVETTDISILDSAHRLGLQLEKRDEPMEVVVVDSCDDLASAN